MSRNHHKKQRTFHSKPPASSASSASPTTTPPPSAPTSWDPVANWYSKWSGEDGSDYHRKLAIPTLLELLQPRAGETILDIGCGTGILRRSLPKKLRYIGVDASPRLLATARKHHGRNSIFLQGDASKLPEIDGLQEACADAAVFLMSIQDMEPIEEILRSAAWAIKPSGRLVVLMLHPCFRIPRQSGWGWDADRKLQYRRVDTYLSPLAVPVRPIAHGKPGSIKAHHQPLHVYLNGIIESGLNIDRIVEVPAYPAIERRGKKAKAENRANREIPLYLAIRATASRASQRRGFKPLQT